MMSRGPAVLATTLALACVNAGLAILIVTAIGVRAFAPLWLGLVLLVVGVVAAVGAITLWRAYLQSAREPSSPEP